MKIRSLFFWMGVALLAVSCQDEWGRHYEPTPVVSDEFEVYSGTLTDYMTQSESLKTMTNLFKEQGIFDKTQSESMYTYLVCEDQYLASFEGDAAQRAQLALHSVSDVPVSPNALHSGFGIRTRLGKNVWIQRQGESVFFDNLPLKKVVKTDNGYLYLLDGALSVRPSIYDQLNNLSDDYSLFKALVKRYEETFFDADQSEPIGVDPMGNTVYRDSVWETRHTLMDRYDEDGHKVWDMRSEDYLSTMFIPNNALITRAIEAALDSLPRWMHRDTTPADREKFEKWIVRACFVPRRLDPAQVSVTAPDIYAVGGHVQTIDLTQDVRKYDPIDAAMWRPSVQKVNVAEPVALSNGMAYFVEDFKIPNHVVIYRVKARFYELWGAMTDEQKDRYFRWENWIDPLIINDAQSPFTLSETLPTMYYHVLAAIPSPDARRDSLVCKVDYDGLLFNSAYSKDKRLAEVHLPAGEYYLRMGFKHSLRYSINIYFNDSLLVKDMLLHAQGSNFHFDRGAVSDMVYYGSTTIGFPEGYVWQDWIEQNEKAPAYDTDGYQVAIVTLKESGNFRITITSDDESYLFTDPTNRSKNNVTQLMMYHWCLRPTINNY